MEIEDDPVHLAAAEWLLRLQEKDVALSDIIAWQKWMNERSEHAQAFARIEQVSQAAVRVPRPAPVTERETVADAYDASLPLGTWRAGRRRLRRRIQFAAAASVAAVAVIVGVWMAGSSVLRPAGNVFSTAVGENREVSLADGSKVMLGGDTSMTVALSAQMRAIELSRGEAFFIVARDRSRPFKVHAGDATVTAVGTQFNVKRDSDRAVVAVTEGRVVVERASRFVPAALLRRFEPTLQPVHVDAGQQTTAGDAGIDLPSHVEDPSTTTSWQSGRLAFRQQPLRYVLEDVNRYSPKPIEIEDERIGELLITGSVSRENVTGWIGSLERAFHLQAVEEPDRIVLR